MIESFIALFAPHECMACTAEGSLLCDACMSNLPASRAICYRCEVINRDSKTCTACRRVSALRSVTAFTSYEGAAKDLVWNLKFGRAKAAAHDIARQLLVPPTYDHPTVVAFVPTATSRIRMRGYDQARVIAKSFARLHRLPFAPILVRTDQRRQVGASGELRRQQLQKSFRMAQGANITDKHVIIVDDVVTSGATLESVASVLKQAGAWRIDATVFARAGTPLRS